MNKLWSKRMVVLPLPIGCGTAFSRSASPLTLEDDSSRRRIQEDERPQPEAEITSRLAGRAVCLVMGLVASEIGRASTRTASVGPWGDSLALPGAWIYT